MSTKEARNRASRKYQKKALDQVRVWVRKDGANGVTLKAIQAAAARSGQSVNAWILEAIREAL